LSTPNFLLSSFYDLIAVMLHGLNWLSPMPADRVKNIDRGTTIVRREVQNEVAKATRAGAGRALERGDELKRAMSFRAVQDGKAVRIEVEESGRLSPERLGRSDRRNDLSGLILAISEALKRQADEKGRAELIRQCGRRWKRLLSHGSFRNGVPPCRLKNNGGRAEVEGGTTEMTRRAKSTSCRPAPTAAFIAGSAPKPSFCAPIPWRQKLRVIVVAGGCALLAATAFALDAAGQAQNQASESRQLQGRARVSLQSLHPIVEQVLPAVVNVSVAISGGSEGGVAEPGENETSPSLPTSPFEEFLRRYFGLPGAPSQRTEPQDVERVALGSGFIIDPAGYVVTNNHVVEQAGTITVILQDNSRHPAKLVGRDALTDLALLKIESDGKLPYLPWGDSDAAQVGDWVMAVGNPYGLGGTVTAGIISARGRNIESGPYDDFLQIDAPINRGDSGGPTFNMDGEVIGINTAILSPSGGSIGIGFAIPSSVAKPVIDQLRAHGKVDRGWLGVQNQPLTPQIAKSLGREGEQGALVAAVTPDSPAAKAGVKQGDIVLSFAGKRIVEPRDLSLAVATAPVGKEAALTVWRDGKELEFHTVIGLMPKSVETARGEQPSQEPLQKSALGLQFAPLTDEARQKFDIPRDVQGVVVADVAPDSPAADQIEAGDVIESVNQRPVRAPTEAAQALEAAAKSANKNILVLINRAGTNQYVAFAAG
jgi:serine protease Do